MVFHHIVEAIQYAQKTGNVEPLQEYLHARLRDTNNRIMPVVAQPVRGDDIYFLLAFAETLSAAHRASMTPDERALVDAIKKDIQFSVVKIMLPGNFYKGDGS